MYAALAGLILSWPVAGTAEAASGTAPAPAADSYAEVVPLPHPLPVGSAPRTSSPAPALRASADSSCDQQQKAAQRLGRDRYACVEPKVTPAMKAHFEQARREARDRLVPTGSETFNSACGSAFADRWYHSNRFTMCFQYGFVWLVRNSNGTVRSEVEFAVHQQMSHVVNGGTDYTYETWITPIKGRGDLLVGGGITSALACSTGCTTRDTLPGEQPIVLDRKLYGNFRISQPTARSQFTVTVQRFDAVLSAPSAGPLPISFLQTPATRCDSGFPERNNTTGCIFRDAIGVYALSVSDSTVNETAAHILSAQDWLPGHPGRFGDGFPLTYEADKKKQDNNRTAVCGKFVPLPTGSCDEYPFASSKQGGDPATVSVEDVDLDDNTRAGGRLGNTYQRDRLLDGERYWAYITA